MYKNPTCQACEADALRDRLMTTIAERGGTLVEGTFTGMRSRYRLRCAKGHEWVAQGDKIVAGSWCRQCATEARSARLMDKDGLARLQAAARDKGGRCLSTEYAGRAATYELECAHGHRWQTKGEIILNGHWCPRCRSLQQGEKFRRPDGLQQLRAAAAIRGGVCLDDRYTGRMSRYRFRCAAGHEWQSFAGTVLDGGWCTQCRQAEADVGALERLRVAAAALGWRCLSGTWQGYGSYEFECASGHQFQRNATALLYHGEHARCEVCEGEVIRDRWLATVAARSGELLNGPFMGLAGRYRLRCAVGHEWETTGEAIRKGQWCPECGREKSARCNILADGLARLQAIAQQHHGRCLATEYMRSRDRYGFECSQGHRWEASGQMVVSGHWCPQCAGLARRLTLEAMQALAAERGGLCLSTQYLGAHVKLTWQCHWGHVWEATPSNVKSRGQWCRNCAILRSTKNRVKRLKWDFEGRE
ncbi:hypothetical protein [Paraburkholderia adhaesiva]|uniref:hypothetical protein n=1 Tax=Paraburkholderia adhaesiva TaxID=2883244 RepID=UPI001F43BF9A|nr:hypothetical protein [Paraburkholderia adhaesiva]